MKYYFRILAAILAYGILLFDTGCQPKAKEPIEPNLPKLTAQAESKVGPRITFEKVVHNFGEVGPGTKNTFEFKFTNTGDDLLKIKRIQSTCGCTVPKLAKKEYAPRESGTVTVTYSAPSQRTSITKHLYAHSNAKKPKVRLTIKAKVVPKVAYEPKVVKLLLRNEDANVPQITLKSLDENPFRIEQFKATNDSIIADYNQATEATEFVIELKPNIEKLRKNPKGRIEIKLTHPQCKKITIRFEALAEFIAKPQSLVIFKCEPAKPVKRQLWILSNYNEQFEIESTSSKKGTVEVISQEKVDNRYKLEVVITPPPARSKQNVFRDVLNISIKGHDSLKIPCNGFYKPQQKKSAK